MIFLFLNLEVKEGNGNKEGVHDLQPATPDPGRDNSTFFFSIFIYFFLKPYYFYYSVL